MKTHVLFLLGLVFASSFATAQNTIGVTDFDPDLVDDGYTLIYPHNQPNVYLLDMCGEVVHTWTNADTLRPGNVAYLQENGDIVMTYRPQVFSNDPIWAGGGGATIERRTWDNEVLWSYSLNDSTGRFHHDIEVKADGNVFAIAWEHFSAEEAIQAGRDTSIVPEDGLWSEMILELSPDGNGSAEIVWEWHAWDHLIQDHDSTKSNYGVVSENINKVDVNFGTPSSQPSDWLHINAIDYNPYFEHIMLSVPTFDELWIIDYDNFTPGQLLWRWGNPEAYDSGTEEDQKLFYQHDCHWVYDNVTFNNPDFGKIAVFNNRVPNDGEGNHSAVHLLNPAYADYDNNFGLDQATGTYLPADFDWSYVAPDSIYSSGLSSFQRLENGNSLICYGRWGDTREITPDGELAWRYRTPLVNAGGYASPVSQGTEPTINQNMTFRAHRYPMNFGLLDTIALSSQGPIELNPIPLNVCSIVPLGCTDSEACNYDASAVEDDGSCTTVDECGVCGGSGILEGTCNCEGNVIDAIGICGGDCPSDYNNNGVCDALEVYGCTYPSALNFDPSATSDDGSCQMDCPEGVVGCTYELAENFDPAATLDDGTCSFELFTAPCLVYDGNGDGAVGSGDLLGLLTEFGDSCN